MIGYIARDKDGSLYLYDDCPIYNEKYGYWLSPNGMMDIGQYPEFDNLQYIDEPVKVEIKFEKI